METVSRIRSYTVTENIFNKLFMESLRGVGGGAIAGQFRGNNRSITWQLRSNYRAIVEKLRGTLWYFIVLYDTIW